MAELGLLLCKIKKVLFNFFTSPFFSSSERGHAPGRPLRCWVRGAPLQQKVEQKGDPAQQKGAPPQPEGAPPATKGDTPATRGGASRNKRGHPRNTALQYFCSKDELHIGILQHNTL